MPDQPSKYPLCQRIKDDGIRCGSPALRGKDLCYFHLRQLRLRPTRMIPILEDRNSIQFAATQIMRAVLEDKLDNHRLRLMLYALQVATWNLKNCQVESSNPDVREARVTRPSSTAPSFRKGTASAVPHSSAKNRALAPEVQRLTTND
ncbi:MAG: hypothetical protein ACRD2M_05770 [Terriglobales bacterium]